MCGVAMGAGSLAAAASSGPAVVMNMIYYYMQLSLYNLAEMVDMVTVQKFIII